jgi:UDP-GlcNAc:undecaprenyl-phosphate GlcNAc-1-phosphate transferase
MIFLLTLFLSVLITVSLIPVFSRLAYNGNVLDLPDERKVHSRPIPRVGGAAMAAGAMVSVLVWNFANGFVRAFIAGAAVLVVFGLADDMKSLSPKFKFLGQIIAALIVVLFGGVEVRTLGSLLPDGTLLSPWLAVPLTVVAIVGVTNAINLADGLDGLAGGISLLSFCCIGYLAYLEKDVSVGLAALAFIGAIFGFLRFNTHPATIFMGDTGSQLLGFAAITLALALTQRHTALSPLLPLILLGFPVLDTLTVMITRILRKRSPFSADRNHFHHHLLDLGFRHPESVLVIYVIQTMLALSAIYLRYHSDWFLLGGYILFSATILSVFTLARRYDWRLKRFDFLDIVIVGGLRKMRDEGVFIRFLFRTFRAVVPILLLITCFIPARFPAYVAWSAPVIAVMIIAVWFFRAGRLGVVLRPLLYLLIPFAVYLSETSPAPWFVEPWKTLHNALFVICALHIVLVTKFSRRKEGFRSTPLDFLVLFIVAVFPNLSIGDIEQYRPGVIAAKIIILYFSYEVLLAELRGNFGRIAAMTLLSLLAVLIAQ